MSATGREAPCSFALRYAGLLRPLMVVLGMGPAHSTADVAHDELRVRMGWAFSARIPMQNVQHAERATRPFLLGWGVHGWGGNWLVNASSRGIVRIDFDPPVRALAVGAPVRLTNLSLGLADPAAFLGALAVARTTGEHDTEHRESP